MLDLIIRGGDVVTPQGVVQGDVAVDGETIAAIAAADVLSAETAERVINAAGHIVIPGGIDPLMCGLSPTGHHLSRPALNRSAARICCASRG